MHPGVQRQRGTALTEEVGAGPIADELGVGSYVRELLAVLGADVDDESRVSRRQLEAELGEVEGHVAADHALLVLAFHESIGVDVRHGRRAHRSRAPDVVRHAPGCAVGAADVGQADRVGAGAPDQQRLRHLRSRDFVQVFAGEQRHALHGIDVVGQEVGDEVALGANHQAEGGVGEIILPVPAFDVAAAHQQLRVAGGRAVTQQGQLLSGQERIAAISCIQAVRCTGVREARGDHGGARAQEHAAGRDLRHRVVGHEHELAVHLMVLVPVVVGESTAGPALIGALVVVERTEIERVLRVHETQHADRWTCSPWRRR